MIFTDLDPRIYHGSERDLRIVQRLIVFEYHTKLTPKDLALNSFVYFVISFFSKSFTISLQELCMNLFGLGRCWIGVGQTV